MRSPACPTCSICARTSARNASTSAMDLPYLRLLVEQRQAVIDLLQAAGIRLQARKIVAQATASDGSMRHTSSSRLAARRDRKSTRLNSSHSLHDALPIYRSPPGGRDSPPGPKDSRAGDRERWIDAAHIVQPFGGQAHLRQRGFGRIVERGVGGAGVLLQAA